MTDKELQRFTATVLFDGWCMGCFFGFFGAILLAAWIVSLSYPAGILITPRDDGKTVIQWRAKP